MPDRKQPGRAATEFTEGLDVMDSNGFQNTTDVAGFKRVIGANEATEGEDVVLSNGFHTIVDMTGNVACQLVRQIGGARGR